MNGEGGGLNSSKPGRGNCGVCVGVLGDESSAESGDEEIDNRRGASGSSGVFLGATEVTFESPDPILASGANSAFAFKFQEAFSGGTLGDLRAVLAFELLDTLDLSSCSFFALPNHEFLELGLASSSSSS